MRLRKHHDNDQDHGHGHDDDRTVRARDDRDHADHSDHEVDRPRRHGVEPVSERFGGIDLGGVIGGLLAGLGTLLLLGLVATALGVAGSDMGRATPEGITAGAVVATAVILVLSCWVGGWVAGRISRYDGAANGGLTAFAFLLLVGLSVAIGAATATDVFDVRGLLGTDILPGLSSSDLTVIAVVSAAVIAILSIGAGMIGGRMGDGYHRRADRHITDRLASAVEAEAAAIRGEGESTLTRSRERAHTGRRHR